MTKTVLPEELVQAFKPDYVAPIVMLLCSDKLPAPGTGRLFESGSGWAAETRWQRTGGWGFPVDKEFTPEDLLAKWDKVRDFDDGRAEYPKSAQESTEKIMANANNKVNKGKSSGGEGDYVQKIQEALKAKADGTDYSYDEKDIILYSELASFPLSLFESQFANEWKIQTSASARSDQTCILSTRTTTISRLFLRSESFHHCPSHSPAFPMYPG